ncbi:phage portal protein [Butyricicoccus sp. AF35-5AC]|uniref:phage portal protein n=1 Tax=Butyricicoccus sp. AF35-5AC TaxID=2292003 RepID=UPI000E544279|nr:phage portal protein [Butyricicoccus sp. AF35-5AC]RHP16503.1 phage portal protein [Butyricicoccus sp. AF35-5AC]
MIADKIMSRIRGQTRLTLDDPTGWSTGGAAIFGGKELQAMKLPAVNACIEIISDSVAKMPIYLMDGETRERVPDHPAVRLLTGRPTEALTAFDYHKLMESRRIAYGNAYALILRDKWGQPVELLPIAPGYMLPILDTNAKLWYVGINPKTHEYRKFWPTDVLHYKAFSTDGLEGISYLRRGAETIEAALQAQRYESNYYRNGGQVSGILTTDTDLSPRPTTIGGEKVDIKSKIRAEWESIHSGADNAYRIAVLDNGLKYTPLTATNRDAQFIESKAASVEDIARLFNIPFYKLGAGKESYAANTQAAIEYIQRTLSPIVSEHEQEDTHKLLLESECSRGLQLRRNMMGELRGDWTARAAWYKSMREIGAYSVDDIRALEDLPDVPGGDDRLASLNYVPLEDWRDLSRRRNGADGEEQKGVTP